ncbi:MAG: cytochrome ubiquinol oxidase subunit I, partial [Halovenus sp.]
DFGAEVTGLDAYEENPPVPLVFWSFRIMVGLGFLFIGLALWGGLRLYQGRLTESERYLKSMMVATPLGFAALLTGWYVTEIGRQPWVIQDVLKTGEAASPTLSSAQATGTLALFVVVYTGLILAALSVLKWLIEDELESIDVVDQPDDGGYGPIPGVGDDD